MLSLLRKFHFNKLLAADLHCQQNLKKLIRALSTLNYSTPLAGATTYKEDLREFLAVAPDLFGKLTEYASKYQSKESVKLYEKVLQYNLTKGKQNSGIVTVLMYKGLADKAQLNSENLKLAQYLGWCAEMALSFGYILDDIQDGSITRYGKPCWHTLEEVGLTAINDGLMIFSGIFHILKENFAHKDYYLKLCELFQETAFISILGESMDVQASRDCVTNFKMNRYKSIVENKSCTSIYAVIAFAMHICGFTDPELYKQLRTISYEIGTYVQIDNDFKDCYGDSEKTGKIGTDIEVNKCSWLAVVCMEKASEAQKEIMRECYGKSDPVKIAQVKHLYDELELPKIFAAYKEETINMVKTRIQQDSGTVPLQFYRILLPIFATWSDDFDSTHTSV